MGRAVISGWVPKVKAVPLRGSSIKPSNDAGASEEIELPPYGVCCVCLKRIEDVNESTYLHSKLMRHNHDECSPGGARYRRAISRIKKLGAQLLAQDARAQQDRERKEAAVQS